MGRAGGGSQCLSPKRGRAQTGPWGFQWPMTQSCLRCTSFSLLPFIHRVQRIRLSMQCRDLNQRLYELSSNTELQLKMLLSMAHRATLL